MPIETDEQIIARRARERAVKSAWHHWKKAVPLARKLAACLPSANPVPKTIIVTRGRIQDGSGGSTRRHPKPHR